MSENPPPAFARDYIRSAQVASLGYIAKIITPARPLAINATGAVLEAYINKYGDTYDIP